MQQENDSVRTPSAVFGGTKKAIPPFGKAQRACWNNTRKDFIHTNAIHADECQNGDRVRIAWLPDRICVLNYMGDYRWRVEEAVNSKLHVGDTFSCRVMAQGEVLNVDHVVTANGTFEGYYIGRKNGLTLVERL